MFFDINRRTARTKDTMTWSDMPTETGQTYVHVLQVPGERVSCHHAGCDGTYSGVKSLRHHLRMRHSGLPKIKAILPGHDEYETLIKQQQTAATTSDVDDDDDDDGDNDDDNDDEDGSELNYERSSPSRADPREQLDEKGHVAQTKKSPPVSDNRLESNDEIMVGLSSEAELKAYLGTNARITQDGLFSVIDVIMKLYGCAGKQAAQKFSRICGGPKHEDASISLESHHFSGVGQRPTPVADFENLQKIFAHLPGAIGHKIRSRNANLSVRANATERLLAAQQKVSVEQKQTATTGTTSASVVDNEQCFSDGDKDQRLSPSRADSCEQLDEKGRVAQTGRLPSDSDNRSELNDEIMVGLSSEAELKAYLGNNARITSDGLFSIIDVILKLYGCTAEQARLKFRQIRQRRKNPSTAICWKAHHFSGVGQRPTPVANFQNLQKILALLPGAIGCEIRSRNATLSARANADELLSATQRKVLIEQKQTATTSTTSASFVDNKEGFSDCDQDQRLSPSQAGPTEQLDAKGCVDQTTRLPSDSDNQSGLNREIMVGLSSEAELKACLGEARITSDGLFSIIDVIKKLFGCTAEQSRLKFRKLREQGKISNSPARADRTAISWESHHFSGERQRPTPVANFLNLQKILALLPGAIGREIRSRNATLSARANAGGR